MKQIFLRNQCYFCFEVKPFILIPPGAGEAQANGRMRNRRPAAEGIYVKLYQGKKALVWYCSSISTVAYHHPIFSGKSTLKHWKLDILETDEVPSGSQDRCTLRTRSLSPICLVSSLPGSVSSHSTVTCPALRL